MAEDRFQQIQVGDVEEFFHVITEEDVNAFASLTGDRNPLHMSESFAQNTQFRKRVVHGMLTASFISTMIGTKLPGEGALWFEQSFKFLSPVRIGERIRIWAKVLQKSEARRIIVLETKVYGDDNRLTISGEGKVEVVKTQEDKKYDLKCSSEKPAVIVTGASRGIGAVTAFKLAEAGYKVVVNYNKDEQSAYRVVEKIALAGGKAIAVQADVSQQDQAELLVARALAEFGDLDGVVNNASPAINIAEFQNLTWESFQRQIDVHVKGAFHVIQAALPIFLKKGRGAIVNMGSISASNVPPINMVPYCLCKAAICSLTRGLAVEYWVKGIRVNTVSPGMTETDLIADVPTKSKLFAKMSAPLRRIATPDNIADVVVFLISEKSQHMTGQNISVCGGIHMSV